MRAGLAIAVCAALACRAREAPRAAAPLSAVAPAAIPAESKVAHSAAGPELVVIARGALGVRVELRLWTDARRAARLAELAFAEIERVEQALSSWRADSELVALNAQSGAGWVATSARLDEALALALEAWRETEGGFDPSIAPVLRAYGFYDQQPRAPSADELARARARVGAQWLEREPGRVRRLRAGLELDLGGMSKGYAADRVLALLRAQGLDCALVLAGESSIAALGAGPDGAGWPVRVGPELPDDEPQTWWLCDEALSSAGRMTLVTGPREDERSHIVDPMSALPSAAGVERATVRSPTGVAGDLVDTALIALGPERACAWLARRCAQDSRWSGRLWIAGEARARSFGAAPRRRVPQ